MKRILAALSVFLFANLASAEDNIEVLGRTYSSVTWACTGWDNTEYPDPFILRHRSAGMFVMSDEDEVYQLHPDYFEEFLAEKDPMTVVAYLIDRRSGDLDKSEALVLTQWNKRLEVMLIDGIQRGTLGPFKRTDRTYCNRR